MKILVLSLDFYDYTKQLIGELVSRGHFVTFFDVRPYRTNEIQKYRFKTNPKFRAKALKKYADYIISKIKDTKYDLILGISINTFEANDLKRILDSQQKAKKIYYMWDSLSNFPNLKDHFPLFDKVYSFDLIDSEHYGLIFQPTFVGASVAKIAKQNIEPDSDVAFIAVTHPHRYVISKNFEKYAKENNIVYKPYLYTRSLGTIEFLKLHNKAMRHASLKNFKFKRLSEEEKTLLLAKSRATLDIPYGTQYGYTQRAEEALVLKRKIITTDQKAALCPEYCADNIAIITPDDFRAVTPEFLSTPFKEYPYDLAEKYSVKRFVDVVIEENL